MRQRVLIVGGGIIGLSSALAAAERGMEVTVIDRISPHGDNCSLGNSGMVVPSHFIPLAAPGVISQGLHWLRDPESPFYIQPRVSWDLMQWGLRFYLATHVQQVEAGSQLLRDMNLASRELYLQWQDKGIDSQLVKRGLLMLCSTQHGLEEEGAIATKARSLGIPASVLTPEETASLDPNVTYSVAGSVYYPKDCHLDPMRLMSSLRSRLESLGVKLLYREHVTGWKKTGGRIAAVCTKDHEFDADEFVLCGGIWSDGLVRELKLRLPMQPGKGYSLTVPDPVELPSVCSILVEAKVAVTPMGQSLRFGGTMQLGELNQAIDPRRVSGIIKNIPRYMPRFKPQHFDGLQPWCGLRPVSPDGLPFIGRTQAYANLTVATGHAMMGISLGPITGQLVSEVLRGEKPSIDLRHLSPDRFANS
ncbi:MAG: FAD-dependent oxidoreductase [Planctomycetes bacterium]|nr:FAD-dependent oxidoreductase [Planctomycetota bacterium]